jgi:PAS domain S-box-containing protein
MTDKLRCQELENQIAELKKQNEILKLSEKTDNDIRKAQKKSEDFFKGVIENTSDIIVIVNEIGTFKYVSPSVENILGYRPDEMIGKKIFQYIHTADIRRAIVDYGRAILSDQVIVPNSFRILHKDGSTRVLEGVGKNQFKNPAIAGFIMNVHDITKRKKVEESLQESEKKYRSFFENSIIGIYRTTAQGDILSANPALLKMLGYSSWEELKTRNLEKVGHEAGYERSNFKRSIEKNGKVVGLESAWTRKDGSSLFILENAIAKKDNDNNILYYDGTVEDITERKQAEESLLNTNARHSAMIENIGDVIAIMGADGITKYQSPNIEKWFGWTPEDLVGKNGWDKMHPEDIERIQKEFVKMLEKETSSTVEYRFLCKDGTFKWIELTAINRTNDTTINGVLINYHDISKRKQGEEALTETARQLKTLVNNLQGIAFRCKNDANWTMEYISEGFKKLTAYSTADIINNNKLSFNSLIVPEQRDQVRDEVQKALAKKERYELIYKMKTADGSIVQVLEKGEGIYDESTGKVIALEGFITDITKQKHTESELIIALEKATESEAKFKKLSNLTFEGIVLHQNGIVIDINLSFAKTFGYTHKEIIGKNIIKLIVKEEYHNIIKQNIIKNYALPYEIVGLRKDGTELPLEVEARDVESDDKKIRVVAVRVISERKKFEKELQKQNKELIIAKEKAEESDSLKSAFLANMSHEIRTPMNGILGFANLLNEPNLSKDKIDEYAGIINKSGERLLNTINDIIDISKIEAGEIIISKKEISINNLMDELYSFHSPDAKLKGLTLLLEPSTERLKTITDSHKLHGILTNLIKNAIKYTEQGHITFGYVLKDNFIEFFVKDTGIGIPENRIDAVFNRFEQADIADTMVFEGSGLGLAISKAYVEMLGGEIFVEPEEGNGTKFVFTIPYTKDTHKETEKNIERINPETLKLENLNLLIVEDDEVNSDFFATIFEDTFREVTIVGNGTEAIQLCKNNPEIDLVLMDVKMPVINGYDATRQIREFNKNIIIIAQTAYGQNSDKEKAIAAGCNDYIAKPINKAKLLALIHTYFNK